jgi:hypothetical protein
MAAPVYADGNTDKVVAKMTEGDISAIYQGGRETITAASSAGRLFSLNLRKCHEFN